MENKKTYKPMKVTRLGNLDELTESNNRGEKRSGNHRGGHEWKQWKQRKRWKW